MLVRSEEVLSLRSRGKETEAKPLVSCWFNVWPFSIHPPNLWPFSIHPPHTVGTVCLEWFREGHQRIEHFTPCWVYIDRGSYAGWIPTFHLSPLILHISPIDASWESDGLLCPLLVERECWSTAQSNLNKCVKNSDAHLKQCQPLLAFMLYFSFLLKAMFTRYFPL